MALPTIDGLAQFSDEQIKEEYNKVRIVLGSPPEFWLAELDRRENNRKMARMEAIAARTLHATWIASAMAIAALIISILSLLGNNSCR